VEKRSVWAENIWQLKKKRIEAFDKLNDRTELMKTSRREEKKDLTSTY